MKKTILATGMDGLVGTGIDPILSRNHTIIPISVNEMDITNKDQVMEVLEQHTFDTLLHLAAYTNVDGAEEHRDLAYSVNVQGTKNLFDAARRNHAQFVLISTDFVFDGTHPPYFEDSTPHPIQYYGETKYESEKLMDPNDAIVRISFPYGAKVAHKKDIVDSLIDLLKEGRTFSGITDQIMTPTLISDIGHALDVIIGESKSGVFHINGSDSMSGYEMIETIAKVHGLSMKNVLKTTYDEFYAGKAPRPKNMVMKTKRNDFWQMKAFEEGLGTL